MRSHDKVKDVSRSRGESGYIDKLLTFASPNVPPKLIWGIVAYVDVVYTSADHGRHCNDRHRTRLTATSTGVRLCIVCIA